MFYKIDDSPEKIDKHILNNVVKEVEKTFPIEGNFYKIEVSNVKGIQKEVDLEDVKNAILKGKSLFNEIRGDVCLIRKKDNKKIECKKNILIAKVPKFSPKETFIIDGNSYAIPNQQRLKPGTYLFERKNGEIVTIVNPIGNRQFKITLNPDTGVIYFNIGNSNVSVVSILKALGVSDEEIKRKLGKKLYEININKTNPTDLEKFIKKSYSLPNDIKQKPLTEQIKYIFDHMELDPDVNKRNFGVETSKLTPELIFANIKQILKAYRGEEVDLKQKNNLANRKVLNAIHLMPEYFAKNSVKEIFKIKQKLNNPALNSLNDVFNHNYLTDTLKSFLTVSKISRMPEEYNPIQTHMATKLLTPLGEGGIETDRALTEDDKAIHSSQLGFIDPVVSPEGAKTGITLAVTNNAYVDENGEPAIEVLNVKTGKKEIKTIKELWNKKVAYPASKERAKKEGIPIRDGEKEYTVKSLKDVDYAIESSSDIHTSSTKTLPLINSMDGMRATMAQKHAQQALSLEHREAPIVRTKDKNEDFYKKIAEKTNQVVKSPVSGKVEKITDDYIQIDGHKIKYIKDLPLARKTYISMEPKVKVGDRVKKGEVIAESNYAKDGYFANGVHLRTAWMSMPGNRNDAIIVSETAAKNLTSLHMYKEEIHIDRDDVLDLKKAKALFPLTLSKYDLSKYDEHGVIKKGATVKFNEPLVIKLVVNKDKPITSLEKTLFKPYKLKLETWTHHHDGKVVSVNKSGNNIRVFVKTKSKAQIGDKLSGRYGNKGSISLILPDDKMPKNEKGEPVHIIVTSAGVISRINPGQLIEATLGKVGKKTDKSYVLDQYSLTDNLKFAEEEAKKHGVEQYETLINPETGKPFPQKVFVGEPYTYKLFKDSESGMSATATDRVNINEQPAKGGKTSASSFSNMEINALLAHNAKDLLREARKIKGQKNDAWFEAFRKGQPLPKPAENFAYEKFKALLSQLNVNVEDDPNSFNLVPATDKDIIKKGPKEVKSAETINATDGSPRKGGLFDPSIFGELGNRYAHIKLNEPLINPIYSYEIAFLLGIPEKKLKEMMVEDGVDSIIKKLSAIDINKEIKKLKDENKKTSNEQLKDRNLKIIKFLEKLKNNNLSLKDVAVLKTVPVIPPVYRPIIKDHTGKYGVSDLNLHYQEIINLNNTLKEAKQNKLSKKTINDLKLSLQHAIGAMYGLYPSNNPAIANKQVKGILDVLGGNRPKDSFVQEQLLRKNQFMSGRAVITPSRGDLKLDEIELPEEMGLKMYEPHISREMAKMGYTQLQIKEMIKNKDEKVIKLLHRLGKEIPVVYNRAPSLWKHNLIGAYPKFVPGHSISLPPMVERALAADYDGDQIAVHVPVTPEGIKDVKEKMLASKQLFTDQGTLTHKDLLMITDQDAVIGAYKASIPSKKKPIKVHSIAEIKKLIREGKLNYNDPVILE